MRRTPRRYHRASPPFTTYGRSLHYWPVRRTFFLLAFLVPLSLSDCFVLSMLEKIDDEFESEVVIERRRRQEEAQRKRPAVHNNNNNDSKRAPSRAAMTAANTTRPRKKSKKYDDINCSQHSTTSTATALSRMTLPLVSRHHHGHHRVGATVTLLYIYSPTSSTSYTSIYICSTS